MDLEKFIKLLQEELDGIPKGSIKSNINYRDLEGFSSMHALIIIAFIDNEFNILLKGNELKETNTIEDLYNMVQSKLNA